VRRYSDEKPTGNRNLTEDHGDWVPLAVTITLQPILARISTGKLGPLRAPILFFGASLTLRASRTESGNAKSARKAIRRFQIGVEVLIERFPRISEPLQVCRALRQAIGAFFHELDRIAVAQDFDRTTVTQFTRSIHGSCDAGLSVGQAVLASGLLRRQVELTGLTLWMAPFQLLTFARWLP
jgi:hypothetical protein